MKNAVLKSPVLAVALLAAGAVAGSTTLALAQTAKAAAPVSAELSGAARAQALAIGNEALNRAPRMTGRFLQVAPNGAQSQGTFYLQRPGKLRFEYDSPNPLTIVSNGNVVSLEDRALKTVEHYPLRATPLYFVLKSNVNLEADGRVTRVIRHGDTIEVMLRDRKGEAEGSITMYFDAPSKELRKWRIIDGQGSVTNLTLGHTKVLASIDPKLFVPKPMRKPGTARPN
jgi:outer membrane lipoprotein-sorting protein